MCIILVNSMATAIPLNNEISPRLESSKGSLGELAAKGVIAESHQTALESRVLPNTS